MAGPKMTNAPRGTKIVTESGPPMHGEEKVGKSADREMKGGPRDLSRTISGASVPGGAKGGD